MTSRRRFLRRAGGALGLGGALAGCGYRPGGGDVRWRASGNFATVPTRALDVTDGLVVTVAASTTSFDLDREEWVSGGGITAYSTADGAELWSDHLDADLSCHAVGDGGAAVGFDGTIVRYGADGRHWEFGVDEPLLALGVAGEWVYALTESGALVGCSDGVERWWIDLESELGGADAGFDPVVAASADAVLCSVAGTVYCVDRSGRRRWSRSEVDARRFSFVDGDIFASSGTGLAALDGSTGDPRWLTDDRTGTFAVTADAAYCTFDAELRAYDRSGNLRWAIPDDRRSGRNRPELDRPDYRGRVAADAEGVYVDSSAGLTAIDPADGRVRWRLSNRTLSAGPYLVESGVLVVDDGELVCRYR